MQPRLHDLPNCVSNDFLRGSGVDHHAAIRVARCNRQIGVTELFVERGALPFKPVRLCIATAQPCSLEADLDRKIEDHRQVGSEFADRNALEDIDQFLIDLPENALIDSGGIRKSIANDPFAGSQRRKNRTLHVVIARSREEHGFDIGPEWLSRTAQQDVTNDLGARRAAGLARQLSAKSARLQTQRQHRGLRGLACPFAAFECYELAARHMRLSAPAQKYTPTCLRSQRITDISYGEIRRLDRPRREYNHPGGNAHVPVRFRAYSPRPAALRS